MPKIKKTDTIKTPDIKIDKSLDKYNGVVLFPEKLAKANETLKRIGIPKNDKK